MPGPTWYGGRASDPHNQAARQLLRKVHVHPGLELPLVALLRWALDEDHVRPPRAELPQFELHLNNLSDWADKSQRSARAVTRLLTENEAGDLQLSPLDLAGSSPEEAARSLAGHLRDTLTARTDLYEQTS